MIVAAREVRKGDVIQLAIGDGPGLVGHGPWVTVEDTRKRAEAIGLRYQGKWHWHELDFGLRRR